MDNKEKDKSVMDIVITVLAVIIIFVLAFLFYYYAIKMESVSDAGNLAGLSAPLQKQPETRATEVIDFQVPSVLPDDSVEGKCFASSVAQPYRNDAFRCLVKNSIYDPCFATAQEGIVFCQTNPFEGNAFLIKLTEKLPAIENLQNSGENWGWFVELSDGTYCSPFTGTRPVVDDNIAFYGCQSDDSSKIIVLFGDLISGTTWRANKAVLTRSDSSWQIDSVEAVNIDSVWK